MSDWPFGQLRMFGYGAILIDPPWSYKMRTPRGYAKSPEAQYATMADDEILALPVGQLAQRDCLLFMWAVWPKLPLALDCIKAWGFSYVTGGPWVKRTPSGKLRWGTGYCMRTVNEPFLIARLGEPQARLTNVPNIIEAEAREHSRKPPEARQTVERMTPHAFRCELFAREPWPGNDVWGNETDKFAEVAA
jgi:N6-adenosine-specific RNA methylase IME4